MSTTRAFQIGDIVIVNGRYAATVRAVDPRVGEPDQILVAQLGADHMEWVGSNELRFAREKKDDHVMQAAPTEVTLRPPPLYKGGDIDLMIHRTARAMEFYMNLHRDKGGWGVECKEHFIEGVLRNLYDFYRAYRSDDKREMMAEGIGVINNIAMFLDNFAEEEMDKVQDWLPTFMEIMEEKNG